jgi:hypothetical protein
MTLEEEIVTKGLTAPRITPADVEANIVGEYYFTAVDGCVGNIHQDMLPVHIRSLELLTFCVLVTKNGFTVTGENACVSPKNF